MFSQRKCRGNCVGGMLVRRRVHVAHVSIRLEEMWPLEFMWAIGILINDGDFDPTRRRAESIHRRSVSSAPVCASQVVFDSFYLSLLPDRKFWVIKEKEKNLIIFIYINVVVFLCYTTCYLNVIWHLSYFVLRNRSPVWSGFMLKTVSGEHSDKATVSFLPILDLNPNDMTWRVFTLFFSLCWIGQDN